MASTDNAAAWQEIYESTLRSQNAGIPLFKPQPSRSANRVSIGDVGYIFEGQFHRILNVLDKDSKFRGNVKPLSVSLKNDLVETPLPLDPIVSDGVQWRASRNET